MSEAGTWGCFGQKMTVLTAVASLIYGLNKYFWCSCMIVTFFHNKIGIFEYEITFYEGMLLRRNDFDKNSSLHDFVTVKV